MNCGMGSVHRVADRPERDARLAPTLAESPLDPNLVWVGTDDGNVQVTRDAGRTWSNVTANIHGVAKNAWVTSVEPSHFGPRAPSRLSR